MGEQYLGNMIVVAIGRERLKAEAARNRRSEQASEDARIDSGMATGARSLFGRALARAGRSLRLGTAPRPEPSSRLMFDPENGDGRLR